MFNYNFTMKSTVVQFISTTSPPLPPVTNRMAERSALGGKREVDSSSRFTLPFSPSHVDSEKKKNWWRHPVVKFYLFWWSLDVQ